VSCSKGRPVTSSRHQVITYDGTTTATITIIKDDETKTCTLVLPRGKSVCP